jgi:3-hydroxyacyl-CoA dehydrogenase
VRALDTPNFVANRVGVFSILAVMHHTQQFGLGFDVVDALTGPIIGRPKSATYRTADVVGLDTMAHVIKTMQDTLPDDPWHVLRRAGLAVGADRAGRAGAEDPLRHLQEGRQGDQGAGSGLAGLPRLRGEVACRRHGNPQEPNPAEKFAQLRASSHPQAQFMWAIFRDIFHYVAVHLADIADNARDIDFAMRWGFGWAQGPFETWQAAGWKAIADAVQTISPPARQ